MSLSPRTRLLDVDDLPALREFLLAHPYKTMHLLADVAAGGIICHGEERQAHYIGAFERSRLCGVMALGTNDLVLVHCPDPSQLDELIEVWRDWFDGGAMGFVGPRNQLDQIIATLGPERLNVRLNTSEQVFGLDCARLLPAPAPRGLVRWALPDDLETLYGWRMACLNEIFNFPLEEYLFEQIRADVDGEMSARHLAVLQIGDQLAGFAQISAEQDNIIKVGLVYISPEWRTQHLTHELLAGLVARSAERGVTHVALFTAPRYLPLIHAATACGFSAADDFGILLLNTPIRPIELAPEALPTQENGQ